VKSTSWFEVDRAGLKELQDGKPKSFLVRELVSNALDENVTKVTITHHYEKDTAMIGVSDDSPEGFKNLKDAFTLFASCYKRPDATKRGRFNLGEKQAFAMCDKAIISTTKGTVVFDKKGRHLQRATTQTGTDVTVFVKMTKTEYYEVVAFLGKLIPPFGISIIVSSIGGCDYELVWPEPIHQFNATLPTVALINGALRGTRRNTVIRLYQREFRLREEIKPAMLYEMGIPVCEIDCDYHINVGQRVPMGIDRDTVSEAYLKHLYAEVLNVVYTEITEDNSSKSWVRVASTDDRVSKDALQSVIAKRYGDKVVVATPNDPLANDDAIASGYRVIHGSELSPEEWASIKSFGLIDSSHEVFGHISVTSTAVEETPGMVQVRALVQRVARTYMGVEVRVAFVESGASNSAQYGNQAVTFNVSQLGKDFFNLQYNLTGILDLTMHELCHEYGHHTEIAYHTHLTSMGSNLIQKAIDDPAFFTGAEQ